MTYVELGPEEDWYRENTITYQELRILMASFLNDEWKVVETNGDQWEVEASYKTLERFWLHVKDNRDEDNQV